MKKLFFFVLSLFLINIPQLITEDLLSSRVDDLSFYLGYMMGREYLQKTTLKYNLEKVMEGLKAAERGEKHSFDNRDFQQALDKLQEDIFAYQRTQNLEDAEKFLEILKHTEGVVEVVPGKVYYKTIKKGSTEPLQGTPLLHFTLRTLHHDSFEEEFSTHHQESEEPLAVNLHTVIEGFKIGLHEMKKKEKRLLYIHPEFGFGKTGNLLISPNQLLQYEIEAIE